MPAPVVAATFVESSTMAATVKTDPAPIVIGVAVPVEILELLIKLLVAEPFCVTPIAFEVYIVEFVIWIIPVDVTPTGAVILLVLIRVSPAEREEIVTELPEFSRSQF